MRLLDQFAKDVVQAASNGAPIVILPISRRDAANGCVIRFRMGSL